MKTKLLEILVCPKCFGQLDCAADVQEGDSVEEGKLTCAACRVDYPIEKSIPRFVDKNNYSSSFGYQWNIFKATQLDSLNGTHESADRFYSETGWTREWLKGKWILDAGCGAGRFLDVAAQTECEVVGVDLSSAIEASQKNLGRRDNVHFIQASIYEMPFRPGTFDGSYCIGVIQHTPEPIKTLKTVAETVKKGGKVAVTIYERKPWTMLYGKYWFRPLTKKMDNEKLLKTIRSIMPVAFPISDVLFRIPVLNKVFKFVIPVANYVEKKDLDRKQRYEWAVLDTFDMFAPAYDLPLTEAETKDNLAQTGVEKIERLNNPGVNVIGEKV